MLAQRRSSRRAQRASAITPTVKNVPQSASQPPQAVNLFRVLWRFVASQIETRPKKAMSPHVEGGEYRKKVAETAQPPERIDAIDNGSKDCKNRRLKPSSAARPQE